MGHPHRKILRERKKAKKKEQLLARRNFFDSLDLTPFNAVGSMRSTDFAIRFK